MNQSRDIIDASIMVVDDEPSNLKLLSEILENAGYAARPVRSGRLALQSVQSSPPDLILLDILMPEMDGFQLSEAFKKDEKTREIPIIFISALSEVEDKLKAFALGGVDYIPKPFQEKEVLARVNTHLDLRRTQCLVHDQNVSLHNEIQRRIQAEKETARYRDHLEEQVRQRTSELERTNRKLKREIVERKRTEKMLRAKEAELEAKTQALEEANIALKVLLDHRDQEIAEVEKNTLATIKKIVLPYAERLRRTHISEEQQSFLNIIEANLANITSSFARSMISSEMGLSTTELEVAELIKDGKSTKEMADMLKVSTHAIDFHRKKIRSKLGLTNKHVNLRHYLQSLKNG